MIKIERKPTEKALLAQEDVEKKIAFRKEGYFGTDEKFVFIPLDDDVKTKNTVKLLHDAYYGTTSQKKMEARIIRKHLRENISDVENIQMWFDRFERA